MPGARVQFESRKPEVLPSVWGSSTSEQGRQPWGPQHGGGMHRRSPPAAAALAALPRLVTTRHGQQPAQLTQRVGPQPDCPSVAGTPRWPSPVPGKLLDDVRFLAGKSCPRLHRRTHRQGPRRRGARTGGEAHAQGRAPQTDIRVTGSAAGTPLCACPAYSRRTALARTPPTRPRDSRQSRRCARSRHVDVAGACARACCVPRPSPPEARMGCNAITAVAA